MSQARQSFINSVNSDIAVAQNSLKLRAVWLEDWLCELESIMSERQRLQAIIKLNLKVALRVVDPWQGYDQRVWLPDLIFLKVDRWNVFPCWIVLEAFLAKVLPINPYLDVSGRVIICCSPQIMDRQGQIIFTL